MRLTIEHETTTDARADGHVEKLPQVAARTKSCLGQRRGAHIGFKKRRSDGRQFVEHRQVEPFDRMRGREAAFLIHQFAHTESDGRGRRRRSKFTRHLHDVIQHCATTATGPRGPRHTLEHFPRRPCQQSGGDLRATDINAEECGAVGHVSLVSGICRRRVQIDLHTRMPLEKRGRTCFLPRALYHRCGGGGFVRAISQQ